MLLPKNQKVPVVELVHPFVPVGPAIVPPLGDIVREELLLVKVMLPVVVLVTVTTPLAAVAVALAFAALTLLKQPLRHLTQ